MMKIGPFVARLQAARQALLGGIQRGDTAEVVRGIEDIGFWTGRSIAELISASEAGMENPSLFRKGFASLFSAQEAIIYAKKYLRQQGAQPLPDLSRPSEFVSFDGKIAPPLEIAPSSIPTAGKGLRTQTAIPAGTVIGPMRAKTAQHGDFHRDWRSLPIAPMVNHSPLPNMEIVRGPPSVLAPAALETCYLVASRDIGRGEELVSDYRDRNWPEWDYYSDLSLPLDQWDRNVMQSMGQPVTHRSPITGYDLLQQPKPIGMAAGLVGGPALVMAARHLSAPASFAVGAAGTVLTIGCLLALHRART